MPAKLKVVYVLSFLPFIVGSILFYYWYFARTCYALNVNIELPAFFTLVAFAVFGFIGFILCLDFRKDNPDQKHKTNLPIFILVMTVLVIHHYSTIYSSFSEQAFINIINDSGKPIKRIYSKHFEITNLHIDHFVVNFQPVYDYDWEIKDNSVLNYTLSPVYIELYDKADSIQTYPLPKINKGACETIHLNEILNKHD